MMAHDTAGKGGRVRSYNKVEGAFFPRCHWGLVSEGKYPYNPMRFQRPAEKSKKKNKYQEIHKKHLFYTNGKIFRLSMGQINLRP